MAEDRYIMRMELGSIEFDPKNQIVNLLDNLRHLGAVVRDAGLSGKYLLIYVQLINPRTNIGHKKRRLESCGIELLTHEELEHMTKKRGEEG